MEDQKRPAKKQCYTSMSRCTDANSCNLDGSFQVSQEFASIGETKIVGIVRGMLLALTSASYVSNEFAEWSNDTAEARINSYRGTKNMVRYNDLFISWKVSMKIWIFSHFNSQFKRH